MDSPILMNTTRTMNAAKSLERKADILPRDPIKAPKQIRLNLLYSKSIL